MLFFLRMLLLAVHFVIASVVGLLIGLCRPFNPDNSRWCARVYGVPAMWILGLRVKLEDDTVRDHQRSAVIVANHISNYDLMVFGLTVPKRTVSLGKKSLKWIPLFGQLYWLAGNVLVDRGNAVKAKRAMLTTTDTLQHKDISLWVFAEGTRGHGKGLQPLKKGAFLMAINAGGPNDATTFLSLELGEDIKAYSYGTSAARAMVDFIFVLTLVWVFVKLRQSGEQTQGGPP